MKSIKINILLLGMFITVFTACTDDYENLPVDQYTIEYVFSDTDSAGVQAVRFLNAMQFLFIWIAILMFYVCRQGVIPPVIRLHQT